MKLNKKMVIMLASVIGVIVVFIIVLMLFAGGGSKKLSFEQIEKKLISAAESYYADNEDELPESGTVSIDVDKLVSKGYIKDLSEYTEDDVNCDGKVNVTKIPTGYTYRANLNCGKKYSTNRLSNVITKDIVTDGSGLYLEEQVDFYDINKTQKVYLFKGESVANYIKVGDFLWQIVKVYENGEIAVLGDPELFASAWDDKYNIEIDKRLGINDYKDSRMQTNIISNVVEDNESFLNIKSLITTHTACIGKRDLADKSRDGSAECSKILENQYFSLLPVYDYINASLDSNCKTALDKSCYNYNYLADIDMDTWMLTGVGDNTYEVYYLSGTVNYDEAKVRNEVRLYAHLDPNVTYISGSGTEADPYIVK